MENKTKGDCFSMFGIVVGIIGIVVTIISIIVTIISILRSTASNEQQKSNRPPHQGN
ncbi:MAG: hypothetical protein LBV33_05185 [Lachnospiraceae bacterium]|jgi:F0F1-type ATP synthase assembly protein I|nr:hypothetical protein [Lachnospiraceae bacterium]